MNAADLRRKLIEVQRERGARSLHYFIREAWPHIDPAHSFSDNWHIQAIAEHLEAVTRNQIRDLLVNVPPGSGKSSIVSVAWNAWQWIQDPTESFLVTSFDKTLTNRDARRVKDLVSSQWFQDRWGDKFRLNENEGSGEFYVYDSHGMPTGGWRFSTSVDGKTTGWHPGIRVIDDPIKPKEITPDALQGVINWWHDTMDSRGARLTRRTCIIMQRVAENDLAGHVLETENFEHLKIPLEYPGMEYAYSTSIGSDPRTEIGESFDLQRMPQEEIVKLKKVNAGNPALVASQYQQEPTPASGTVFEVETFRTWKLAPFTSEAQTYQERVKASLPRGGIYVQSWDLSFKDTEGSDRVCGTTWYVIPGAGYYLVDLICRKMSFVATQAAILAFAAKWPEATIRLVEDKANGPAIMSQLRGVIELIPYDPKNDSKVTRALATKGLFHSNTVFFPSPENDNGIDWLVDFLQELTRFPRGKHDDQVDSLTQALNYASIHLKPPPDYTQALAGMTRLMKAG
jgi:predicted phage terminase large subunit-like protein